MPIMNKLNYTETINDYHLTKLNRVNVMSRVCYLGNADCRSHAAATFQAWKLNAVEIPANLQSIIFCEAIRFGSQEDWNFLYENYHNERKDNIRLRILRALGCSEDTFVLNR